MPSSPLMPAAGDGVRREPPAHEARHGVSHPPDAGTDDVGSRHHDELPSQVEVRQAMVCGGPRVAVRLHGVELGWLIELAADGLRGSPLLRFEGWTAAAPGLHRGASTLTRR